MGKMNEHINTMLNCYRVCAETKRYCLTQGGAHLDEDHQQILSDCIQSCLLHTDFMIRKSQFQSSVSEVCAKICEACAASCESIDADDAQMQKCAQTCQECAEMCKKMS